MRYLLLSFILLFSGCFSDPIIIDYGFEKLKNFTELNVLPDGVPVYFENYEFILTNPTDKYKHGVLGDSIESESLMFSNSNKIIEINFSPQVFEGLFPIVKDNLIITTLSGNGKGAQIVGYDFNGSKVFSSSILNSGWRQVLDFESSEYIFNVVKPHILGELELLKVEGNKLVQVSSLVGYSTHKIGSRNLENYEFYEVGNNSYLILPTFDFNFVAIVSFVDFKLKEVGRIEIGEEVNSIENINDEIYVNNEVLNIKEILN